ncbi:MAG: N-acetylmuramoyl-L-alanine amidase [Ignavibacteria bacterium]|nr:N-acetylmuramoyl-L-alanine amidase [Ignavibacteria bacterium]
MIKRNLFIVIVFILLSMLNGCSTTNRFVEDIENEIITVNQWGGTPVNDSLARKHSIKFITLHHQGEFFPKDRDPIEYLRSLQSWSIKEKKWIDIPYHYIIDLNGKIYEGRNILYAGDTNTEYDPSGHALIEVVGNFEEVEPNELQLKAVVKTMAWLALKYNVAIELIRGHKDYSAFTVCPGKNLYKYLENGYFKERVNSILNN